MDDLSYYKSMPRRAAHHLQAINAGFERLVVTEGDRRRVRLELERGRVEGVDSSKVAIMDRYRRDAGPSS